MHCMRRQKLLKHRKSSFSVRLLTSLIAFDSVWRVGLWKKLLAKTTNGKFFRFIFSMYTGIKSCDAYNGGQSSFFSSFREVRRGEHLSPVLFALFLNDLETFLSDRSCNCVNFKFRYDDIFFFFFFFFFFSKIVCFTLC